ncbi:MAG: hypothetical protein A2Y00_08325 [Omnitrophica WOR_2 bacterium GWF2_43_52]|nr:MAG: hypothetical protein A2Y01_00455 [Omnitrophica WOR_2 bacterium GWC2_44_8]OGX21439.1 MAG: hypothetical protein A2Y00_08325 [Omnitrophica WOR_2 bacterium GWF2_43_52]OGX54910.1 MAG: hypothetical protein A2460_00940 [Omnitrophica WOR_2 bacterium RIFOXYC2_FULL_43_9]HAH21931.1 hypothetical protein [Candidatus Omnitrophota bacterium]HBG64013.1 hypothetical protein [Candidatus Omnitrophota bacterium]
MKNRVIKKGFTLIELITVVVIIAILAALALPQYARVMEKSRSAEARESIGHIRKAALTYYQALGNLSLGAYSAQVTNATGIPVTNNIGTTGCTNPSYFFNYSITGSIPTTTTINATRCVMSGKGPGAPTGMLYGIQLVTDLGGQTADTWTQHVIYQ